MEMQESGPKGGMILMIEGGGRTGPIHCQWERAILPARLRP